MLWFATYFCELVLIQFKKYSILIPLIDHIIGLRSLCLSIFSSLCKISCFLAHVFLSDVVLIVIDAEEDNEDRCCEWIEK